MTRLLLATPANLREAFPPEMMRDMDDAVLHFFIAMENRNAMASTIVHGDNPILLFSFSESDAVRVLVHEEDHRALNLLGEIEASKSLDHPAVARILYHRRGRGYLRAYQRRMKWNRASPKPEAR
jgi:hypothetical protein